MLDRWFSVIRLPMSWRQFLRLPVNPAYNYEYFDKTACLTPRPKFYHARLDLLGRQMEQTDEVDAPDRVTFRRLSDRDWPLLSRPFAASFSRVQPFASLGDRRRLAAARIASNSRVRAATDRSFMRPPTSHRARGIVIPSVRSWSRSFLRPIWMISGASGGRHLLRRTASNGASDMPT